MSIEQLGVAKACNRCPFERDGGESASCACRLAGSNGGKIELKAQAPRPRAVAASCVRRHLLSAAFYRQIMLSIAFLYHC